MQGRSDPDAVLLDAEGLVGHLVETDSVYAFPSEHRERLFADERFLDLFSVAAGSAVGAGAGGGHGDGVAVVGGALGS